LNGGYWEKQYFDISAETSSKANWQFAQIRMSIFLSLRTGDKVAAWLGAGRVGDRSSGQVE
jgi:hypothetical protein